MWVKSSEGSLCQTHDHGQNFAALGCNQLFLILLKTIIQVCGVVGHWVQVNRLVPSSTQSQNHYKTVFTFSVSHLCIKSNMHCDGQVPGGGGGGGKPPKAALS